MYSISYYRTGWIATNLVLFSLGWGVEVLVCQVAMDEDEGILLFALAILFMYPCCGGVPWWIFLSMSASSSFCSWALIYVVCRGLGQWRVPSYQTLLVGGDFEVKWRGDMRLTTTPRWSGGGDICLTATWRCSAWTQRAKNWSSTWGSSGRRNTCILIQWMLVVASLFSWKRIWV